MTATPLSSILVHVDDGPDARARVELALDLAGRMGAMLIGSAAAQPVFPVYAPHSDGLAGLQPEVMEAVRAQAERNVSDARAVFDEVVQGHANTTWRASTGRVAEDFILEQARAADLVVVGRNGSEDSRDPVLGVSPADIVMDAGRPVLVTPPQTQRLLAKRIVVAWKDVREARRALADAMPLLRAADDVFVVTLGEDDIAGSNADVVAALKRADVPARGLVENIGRNTVGNALIECARRSGADLIVAGAFGHSRTREWIFGGATRELLDRAPMCCLFSH